MKNEHKEVCETQKKCDNCVRKDLMDLVSILSNIFDINQRYTWSEQASYKNEIDAIHKRLVGYNEDPTIDK